MPQVKGCHGDVTVNTVCESGLDPGPGQSRASWDSVKCEDRSQIG